MCFRAIDLYFSFLVASLSGFSIRVILTYKMSLGVFYFLEEFRKAWVQFFFKYLV